MADSSDKKTEADKSGTDKKVPTSPPEPENKKSEGQAGAASKDTKPGASPDAKPGSKKSSVPGAGTTSAKDASNSDDTEKRGGGLSALLVIVVIVLVVAGGGFATKSFWLPTVEPYLAKIPGYAPKAAEAPEKQGPSPVEALKSRIDEIEKRLAAQPAATTSDAMESLKAEKGRIQSELEQALTRIDDIERRLGEVRRLAQAVTSSSGKSVDLGPVMTRIDDLEQSGRETSAGLAALSEKLTAEISAVVSTASAGGDGGNGKASGVVLAAAQLRDRALSGQPYASQLTALSVLADGHPELTAAASKLKNNADAGLPTAANLSDQFSDIASDVVILARTGGGDWLEQAAGRLSSLVAIRRTDGQSGDPIEDAVATIESHLAKRDVQAAAETGTALFDLLPSEARKRLEPWLLSAKARAGAERALDALQSAALAGLGG